MWIGIFCFSSFFFRKKAARSEDCIFCPFLGRRFERSTLVWRGVERCGEGEKRHTVRRVGRWSRRAQCMQGHQSITTREPVLFRFTMGSRIVLLMKHIHPILSSGIQSMLFVVLHRYQRVAWLARLPTLDSESNSSYSIR
jgi:hypothetical protein